MGVEWLIYVNVLEQCLALGKRPITGTRKKCLVSFTSILFSQGFEDRLNNRHEGALHKVLIKCEDLGICSVMAM